MPAHEPPMLEDEGTAATTTDAPTEPAAPTAPRFAPRTPEELARAAIVCELHELAKRSPPFDPAQHNADWKWFFGELSKGAAGALGPYAGRFVAVVRAQVIGSGDNFLQLGLDAWKGTVPPVHPEQFIVEYVDPWDNIEG